VLVGGAWIENATGEDLAISPRGYAMPHDLSFQGYMARLRAGDAESARQVFEAAVNVAHRPIVLLRLQGLREAEIADRVGCTLRTVERVLKKVREQLRRMNADTLST
jgi:DNA-directed RNA polymerase specialized sigma24 family protein